jgi:hypothetical protein
LLIFAGILFTGERVRQSLTFYAVTKFQADEAEPE